MADSRPEEELYDLKQDPWETSNLADSPDYQKVKRRLASALDHWMEEIDDQGRIPEDPSIPQYWDERAIRVYSDNLKNRPKDWFLKDAALGPYKVESKKDD